VADESREALRREVLALRKENAALRALVEKLQARIAILEKVSGSGPAAPSGTPPAGETKPAPKPRGRPPGRQGTSWTKPSKIDETVQVPLHACPDCGGKLTDWRDIQDHIVVDLPAIAAIVRCFRHERGYCPHCKQTVRSPRAPDEPPCGHFGLRLLALVTELRTRAGLSYAKLAALLKTWGVPTSAGALAKAVERVAQWLTPAHRELLAKIRDAPVAHADETSWPVNGRNGWSWVFTDRDTTVYVNEPTRGKQVAREVLGDDFGGVLVTDFYAVYTSRSGRHQYCWAHLLREAREVAALGDPVAVRLCEALGAIYHDAEIVATSGVSRAVREREAAKLARRLSNLRKGSSRCPGVERLKNRLARFQEPLLTFVLDPAVEPTNNRAERAVRPMVLLRKTTGGSRSWDGARALAVLASCRQSLVHGGREWLDVLRAHVTSPAARPQLVSIVAN
jgi:transposase